MSFRGCKRHGGALDCVGRVRNRTGSRTVLGKPGGEGETPVGETGPALSAELEYGGARETLSEAGGTTLQG